MSNFSKITELPFCTCPGVLPQVYSEALSYYEDLRKIQIKLNELIVQTNLLITQTDANTGDITNIKSQVTAIQNNLTQVKKDVVVLTSRVQVIENLLSSLTDEVSVLRGLVDSINKQITEIKSDIGHINNIIDATLTKIDTINTSITEIRGDITQINSKITNINSTITELASEISQHAQKIQVLETTTQNLTSSISTIQNEIGNWSTSYPSKTIANVMKAIEGRTPDDFQLTAINTWQSGASGIQGFEIIADGLITYIAFHPSYEIQITSTPTPYESTLFHYIQATPQFAADFYEWTGQDFEASAMVISDIVPAGAPNTPIIPCRGVLTTSACDISFISLGSEVSSVYASVILIASKSLTNL